MVYETCTNVDSLRCVSNMWLPMDMWLPTPTKLKIERWQLYARCILSNNMMLYAQSSCIASMWALWSASNRRHSLVAAVIAGSSALQNCVSFTSNSAALIRLVLQISLMSLVMISPKNESVRRAISIWSDAFWKSFKVFGLFSFPHVALLLLSSRVIAPHCAYTVASDPFVSIAAWMWVSSFAFASREPRPRPRPPIFYFYFFILYIFILF